MKKLTLNQMDTIEFMIMELIFRKDMDYDDAINFFIDNEEEFLLIYMEDKPWFEWDMVDDIMELVCEVIDDYFGEEDEIDEDFYEFEVDLTVFSLN